MRATSPQNPKMTTRLQLLLLLIAAMACVATMLVSFVGGHRIGSVDFDIRHLWLIAAVGGAAVASMTIIWRMGTMARREARAAKAESTQLRRNLAAADSIIRAEPQVLIFWEQGQAVRIVSHTLTSVPGLPEHHAEILRFGQWLEAGSAKSLKAALDTLFVSGRSFSLIAKTIAGGIIEAEGRAAGGRAVLRLKDISGYKLELSRIEEQQTNLARDIRSSRALLNTLPMPVWLRGMDNRLIWVNAAYVSAVEAKTEIEVLERQIELLETRQRKAVAKAIAAGQTYGSRIHLVAKGERKPHDVIVIPVEGMTAGAAIDVTDIESAQGELERQISAYDRTLDRVETAVAIFNSDHKLVFYNAAFAKLWSLDNDWLATHPSDSVIFDRLREIGLLEPVVSHRDWKAQVLACYRTGAPLDDIWTLTDERILHVMAEQRPDGGVTFLFADETERLALEGRYNATIEVQSETLNSLKEGVAVFGTDGRLRLYNKAFSQIWKMPAKRLDEHPHIGEVIAAAQTLHPVSDTWVRIGRAVTSFSDERGAFSGQMVRADELVIDYTLMPLPDGATLLTFADVTDAKRAERAWVERNDALEAADRLKMKFISHISRELRTPLQTITGFSELLSSPALGELNAKQHEYLTDITSSSKTLEALITNILDLATIDAGALQLNLTPVGARSVIDAALPGIHERAGRNRLTINISVDEAVTEFMADEVRIRQVLYNVLSNAVGFSKRDGTIRIKCWRESGDIIFLVADDGVGIPKDELAHIFERFESRSHGSGHRGAGIGLSIVKSLVELHGGTIEVSSDENEGTHVTIRIPEDLATTSGKGPQHLAHRGRAA